MYPSVPLDKAIDIIVEHLKNDSVNVLAVLSYYNILPIISRSKGNHTMKFVQLIEYTMGIIFLEKSYTNVVEKLLGTRLLLSPL